MQVTPVSAIHELRIREKQQQIETFEAETNLVGRRNFTDALVPTYVASAAMRESYHGAHAEYATQLLAGDEAFAETPLERESHVRRYAAATAYEDDARTHTISLSA